MPVVLKPIYSGPERQTGRCWPSDESGADKTPSRTSLHIGLVNNMTEKAMGAAEQQFLKLLEVAAAEMPVHITLYAPEIEGNQHFQSRSGSLYSGIEQLWRQRPDQSPDGLIVTGREPHTSDLRNEACWPSLKRVLAWAQEHGRSTIWSCLAAHAAVLALDGIERVRGEHKHFGILACERVAPHPLLAGAPARLRIPHSRWNGLSAEQLAAKGYQVLTRTSDGGVDAFIKEDGALFVFFQGHPEYEAETLLGEYRRDIRRYLKGERDTYPLLPLDYFDEATRRSLWEIEGQARASPHEDRLTEVSAVLNGVRIDNTWRSTAVVIYRNWLEHLCIQKRHRG